MAVRVVEENTYVHEMQYVFMYNDTVLFNHFISCERTQAGWEKAECFCRV